MLASGGYSPSKAVLTTRSGSVGSAPARHSRTEESMADHYMEMTFNHSESSYDPFLHQISFYLCTYQCL